MSTPLPRPTDGELAILRVLWDRGPSTVRQVRDALSKVGGTRYTTFLKLMQIMVAKGLVLRDESNRTHIYRARASEAETQRQLVGDLLERAFAGAQTKLVMHALASRRASPQDLAEIRRLLDEFEQRSRIDATSPQTHDAEAKRGD